MRRGVAVADDAEAHDADRQRAGLGAGEGPRPDGVAHAWVDRSPANVTQSARRPPRRTERAYASSRSPRSRAAPARRILLREWPVKLTRLTSLVASASDRARSSCGRTPRGRVGSSSEAVVHVKLTLDRRRETRCSSTAPDALRSPRAKSCARSPRAQSHPRRPRRSAPTGRGRGARFPRARRRRPPARIPILKRAAAAARLERRVSRCASGARRRSSKFATRTPCHGRPRRRATGPSRPERHEAHVGVSVSSCASRVTFTMPHSRVSRTVAVRRVSTTSASHRAVSTFIFTLVADLTRAFCGRRRTTTARRLSSRSSRTTSRLVSRSLFCGGGQVHVEHKGHVDRKTISLS